ncbi:hypothetical protein WCX18_10365 [Sulfurimonas sp. HSL1-2]|uniref:hypothetical protein n=1 Tax=Thiomicrolovo zhangzhouensis TaxID=3131933 RepID=UPI0031F8F3E6
MRWIVLSTGIMALAFLAAGRMDRHPNRPVDGKLSVPTMLEMAVKPVPGSKEASEGAVMTALPSDVPALSDEEKAYNRLVATERRIERQRARVAYIEARREWRRALNAARSSGDAEALKRIEALEPVRENRLVQE